jgi:hypothetical protein
VCFGKTTDCDLAGTSTRTRYLNSAQSFFVTSQVWINLEYFLPFVIR